MRYLILLSKNYNIRLAQPDFEKIDEPSLLNFFIIFLVIAFTITITITVIVTLLQKEKHHKKQ